MKSTTFLDLLSLLPQALSQELAGLDLQEDHDIFIPEWEVGVSPEETDEEPSELEKRTDFSGSKLMCFVNGYNWADSFAIKDGIIYLRKFKGRPVNGAGPNACGRVSCSYNSAIWWCNDDNKPKKLASWGSIADGAAYIQKNCKKSSNALNVFTAGKVNHKTKWNVRVPGGKC